MSDAVSKYYLDKQVIPKYSSITYVYKYGNTKGPGDYSHRDQEVLGFEKGSKVQFSQENGKVLVRKASDVSSLMGILKSPKKYDQRKAREAISKDMAKHYLESIK